MITLIIVLAIIVAFEMSTWLVYGSFVDKEVQERYLNKVNVERNPFCSSILYVDELPFVAKLPLPLFCKYYISDVGTVPRWSKLHKELNRYYKITRK